MVSAQAVVTLPLLEEPEQQALLAQTLAGVHTALEEQGATLIGGHTLEARATPPNRRNWACNCPSPSMATATHHGKKAASNPAMPCC